MNTTILSSVPYLKKKHPAPTRLAFFLDKDNNVNKGTVQRRSNGTFNLDEVEKELAAFNFKTWLFEKEHSVLTRPNYDTGNFVLTSTPGTHENGLAPLLTIVVRNEVSGGCVRFVTNLENVHDMFYMFDFSERVETFDDALHDLAREVLETLGEEDQSA